MMALEPLLAPLTAGSRGFAGRDPASRAALAVETARAVAAAADDWVDAALAVKTRHERSAARLPAAAAARAEEVSTGPLATLRLLAITARALRDVGRDGLPRPCGRPRRLHPAGAGRSSGPGSFIGIDVLPERRLFDGAIFRGHSCVVRCGDPGGLAAFDRSWREESRMRPRAGGVALVLGAGNVTGLSVADVLSQVFEHGRAVLLKLHPLHAPLEHVLRRALEPLTSAGLLAIVCGGAELAMQAATTADVTHVHLTGGRGAFDALVWGGPGPHAPDASPALAKPLTCELGNVTPWIVVPGRYSAAQLRSQADTVAASIANNTSFNCIATKCVVTCRGWDQRKEFLALVASRLRSLPARPAWYPGCTAAWESVTGRAAPADGSLPAVFRTDLDAEREPHWLAREWFVPVAVEVAIDSSSLEDFCARASEFARRLPGSLAASVTAPPASTSRDKSRVDLLVEHLEYGVVAVNTWSALAYALASVPWGGYPGGTLAEPGSGIGHVHDPLLLPLVHNSILRAPLVVRPTPPWFPWHARGARLARGVVDMLGAIAAGRTGLGPLVRMLPAVLRG